jgi:hypothetical protein
MNTIAALHANAPRGRYVVAALVDLRSAADQARMAALAAELGARIDVVALAVGELAVPHDVLISGQRLVDDLEKETCVSVSHAPRSVRRVDVGWPVGLPDGGRHGFTVDHRRRLDEALPRMAATLAEHVEAGRNAHVLGFEELMYAPLRVAVELASLRPDTDVTFSTTTRSPVLAVDEPGYAIRSRLSFVAHDNPDDGPGDRYTYNLTSADRRPDGVVVLVVDSVADTPALHGSRGLVDQLARTAEVVLLVVIPGYRPPVAE